MFPLTESTGAEVAVGSELPEEGNSVATSVSWQWCGDHRVWQCYRDDVADIIENTFQSGKKRLDLSTYFPDFPYKISFSSMVQKNKRTKYHRQIRRVTTPLHPSSNFENGIQEGSYCAAETSPSHDSGNNSIIGACAPKTPENKPFIKKVSAFWSKLKKSIDSDSSNSSEEVEESSSNKKQCMTENGHTVPGSSNLPIRNKKVGTDNVGTAITDSHMVSGRKDRTVALNLEFATVNGKVWKHSWPPDTSHSELKPVPGIQPLPCEDQKPRRRGRKKLVDTATSTEIDGVAEFTEDCTVLPAENGEEQICIICYESLHSGSPYDDDTSLAKLQLCSHVFHKSCIKAMCQSGSKDHLQCPTCKTIHGVKCGIQPPGKMVYHVLPYSLPGYSQCDTIRIIYDIPSGIQGPDHPNPGQRYSARGFPRHCYLPDNEMGRKVLRLLIKAWERRLIFTIGTSSTTGETDTVTWNEIHHKTEFGCNWRGHGFPDPNYFENIMSELAAHGVTESTYSWTPV